MKAPQLSQDENPAGLNRGYKKEVVLKKIKTTSPYSAYRNNPTPFPNRLSGKTTQAILRY